MEPVGAVKPDAEVSRYDLSHHGQGKLPGPVQQGIIVEGEIPHPGCSVPPGDLVRHLDRITPAHGRAQVVRCAVGTAEGTSPRGLNADVPGFVDEVEARIGERIEIIHVRNELRGISPELFKEVQKLQLTLTCNDMIGAGEPACMLCAQRGIDPSQDDGDIGKDLPDTPDSLDHPWIPVGHQ